MNDKTQIRFAWCGLAFMASFLIGWATLGGFLPPTSPTATAADLAAFYQQNPVRMRIGLMISEWGLTFLIPFSAVLTVQMARIEGRFPVWSIAHITAWAGTIIGLIITIVIWETAAYRPERAPDLLLLLHDLAWIPMGDETSPFLFIPIAIAMVGFRDKSEHPIFPRWACYYNLMALLAILPGGLVIFFKSGPFAWNGLFGWWIPLVDWGIWFSVLTYLLIKGIKRQAATEQSSRTHEYGDNANA